MPPGSPCDRPVAILGDLEQCLLHEVFGLMQIAHHQIGGPQQDVAAVRDEAIEVVRAHHLLKAPSTSKG